MNDWTNKWMMIHNQNKQKSLWFIVGAGCQAQAWIKRILRDELEIVFTLISACWICGTSICGMWAYNCVFVCKMDLLYWENKRKTLIHFICSCTWYIHNSATHTTLPLDYHLYNIWYIIISAHWWFYFLHFPLMDGVEGDHTRCIVTDGVWNVF